MSYIGISLDSPFSFAVNPLRVVVVWLVSAAVLSVAGVYLRRTMSSFHPAAMRVVWVTVSSAALLTALYAGLYLAVGFSRGLDSNSNLATVLYEGLSIASATTSSLAFTLGALGMTALGLAQWRAGNQLRVAGTANLAMGLATLLLWIEIAARLGGISNHESFLDVARLLSWPMGFIVLSWWTITGLIFLMGIWKSSRQNRISLP